MELQTLLNVDYLDILFKNRNKKYGSYELRKNYERRTLSALAIVIGLAAMLVAYGVYINGAAARQNRIADVRGKEHQLTQVSLDLPKPKPVIERPELPAVKATIEHTMPVIAKDDAVTQIPKPIEEISDSEPGETTAEESSDDIAVKGLTASLNVLCKSPIPEKPVHIADEMPEFIGDINAYLSANIRYPERAREAGIDGKVIVQFVVDGDGNVTCARVLGGIGGGCDEEALRVVSAMPRWKAGKQNGRAVSIYYTLPIRFLLE